MDQLCEYLSAQFADQIATSSKDETLLFWSAGGKSRLATLLLGYKGSLEHATAQEAAMRYARKQYRKSLNCRHLYRIGMDLSQNDGFLVIVFPDIDPNQSNSSPLEQTLLVASPKDGTKLHAKEGRALAQEIHNLLGVSSGPLGAGKAVNRAVADYFHYWSRATLSRSISKVDVDAFLFGEKQSILVEVKRSSRPPIPRWRPYSDDEPDFRLQIDMAQRLGARFAILHHETNPNSLEIDTRKPVSVFWPKLVNGEIEYEADWNPITLSETEDSLVARLSNLAFGQ